MPSVFFFNDPSPTETYTLSLHDALPIWDGAQVRVVRHIHRGGVVPEGGRTGRQRVASEVAAVVERQRHPEEVLVGLAGLGDRKSTRLNSSHSSISYAVFCLKKKTNKQ